MKNLDYTLIDAINRHQEEREAAEFVAKVENAKRAGTRMAHIEIWALMIIALVIVGILDTPH